MFVHAIDKRRKRTFSSNDLVEVRDKCIASNIGRANRIVSRIFEDAFRDVGISAPQFALLLSLAIRPGMTSGEIAEGLSSDRSTVSRNTEVLLKRDLIRVEFGEDRRVRSHHLTPSGDEVVQSCVPRWKAAQRKAIKKIGRGNWREMRRWLRGLSN
jgi:DNA-binding MarR family transcriptional regulator